MLDLRELQPAVAPGVVFMLLVSFTVAAIQGAPLAVIGDGAASSVGAQQALGDLVHLFATPASARRWLRQHQVA